MQRKKTVAQRQSFILFSRVRQECDSTCAFDSNSQFTLMFSANAGNTARQDFTAFCCETAKLCSIFVIDQFSMINAEAAYFSSLGFLERSLLMYGFLLQELEGACLTF